MRYIFGPPEEPEKYLFDSEDGLFQGLLERRRLRLGDYAFRLLHLLVHNPENRFSNRKIADALKAPPGCIESQFARDHIAEIRDVLRRDSIENQRSLGYKFAWPVKPATKAVPPGTSAQPKGILRALRVPEGLLPREAAVAKLKRVLLRPAEPGQRTLLTAAAGQGGIGKTVLASLAMQDPHVQARFPDGILALTIGQRPAHMQLESEIRQIPRAFGESPDGWERNSAFDRIEALLQDRSVLVVIDDVWDVNDIGWMPRPIGNSAILITTRFEDIKISLRGIQLVNADLLEPDEARELLANHSGVFIEDLPPEADEILRRCGGLALAVSMAGAMLNGVPIWGDVLALFRRSRTDEVSASLEFQKHRSIFEITDASVEFLPDRDRSRYLGCCVFPDDTPIPEAVFGVLWNEPDTYRVGLAKLKGRYLLDWSNGFVTFHDLQLAYLRRREEASVIERHRSLLDSYRARCEAGWHTGPNDGYFFQHLVSHLFQAGLSEQARELIDQLEWLEKKLNLLGVNQVLADFRGEESRGTVARGLRQASHILSAHPQMLCQQLLARVPASVFSAKLLAQCRARPGWQPVSPSLDADPALKRTLEGHSGRVMSVAVNGDEVVSGSDDQTIRIWDRNSGELKRTLEGHSGWVTSVAVNGD